MMLAKFRNHYPQGSLISELVKIDRGLYIVRVSIQVQDIILVTALAGADRVETAEDVARERAIAALALDSPQPMSPTPSTQSLKQPASQLMQPAFTPDSPDETISDNTGANTNVVNWTEQQSEILNQPSIPEQNISSSPTIPESRATQPPLKSKANQTIQPEIQPIVDSGNLFDETFAPETSATTVLNDDSNGVPEPSTSNAISVSNTEIGEVDFNEIKQKTDIEIKRLGWTKDDGRDFLKSRYGKRSRLHLTDEQLLEFLHYLESLPSPN